MINNRMKRVIEQIEAQTNAFTKCKMQGDDYIYPEGVPVWPMGLMYTDDGWLVTFIFPLEDEERMQCDAATVADWLDSVQPVRYCS